MRRAKVEAAVKAPAEDVVSPKKKWWNAKNVIAGLQQVDESELSLGEDNDEDDDSDEVERKRRQKLLEKVKKGKRSAKMMESPVKIDYLSADD